LKEKETQIVLHANICMCPEIGGMGRGEEFCADKATLAAG
jgi:hypothetical protein